MIRVIVAYNRPADPAAFDRHYTQVHAPLAAAMPGLQGFEYSRSPPAISSGQAPYLVAILSYADRVALEASLASPAGQAALADVETFATGGCLITTIETASGV